MAQIASLLAVVTVFIGLWTLIFTFYSQGGGAYTRDKTCRGGVFAGFYGIIVVHHWHNVKCNDTTIAQ